MAPNPDEEQENEAPLLNSTKNSQNSNGASYSGAIFNLSTSAIGAGIMSIPATLKVLGVLPAILSVIFVAILTNFSLQFMLKFTSAGNSTTYAGLMEESFGKIGSVLLQICVIITNLGAEIIYMIIIADVLSGSVAEGPTHVGIFREWFGNGWWTSRSFVLLVTTFLILLPLVSLRRVDSLKFTSAISVLLAVVFAVVTAALGIVAIWTGEAEMPRLFPQITGQFSYIKLFTVVPVLVSAFTCHFNVHPIRAEFRKPQKMQSVVRVSLALCAVVYIAIGLFCYLLFGENTASDILVNFNRGNPDAISSAVVRLSYVLHVMLVFPLLNFSLRINLDGLAFPSATNTTAALRFTSLTGIILGFVYLAAILIPDIWSVFQFVGSTTAVCIDFIFPGAIVLRDVHGISDPKDRILAVLMILIAVVTSAIAITSNLVHLA
ncbi:probable sodium-coupled neutral amino acid transporter 6 [Amborella trichopoda]|uniref:Amino acid transporter transmembrane domain-containing protein n=1 Tax=Amborella trichopoda TaxID=13333 RepID=W1PCC9_AMBTC|nr:probable sodium-coupled neutral amino acid transporter 6 [Amborella trichopoda]ERN05364.1 hypothetical protein AMTR_s00007p00201200 [Amborella trichopoda]|eukprot:XP_006843689.1 probable sodium-coupled neutral amino acid transporter 6 [Amborella trichopoda]